MERHGYYKKYTNISGKKYYIRILRVRCKVCGHTHAILPDFIVPYLHNPIIDLSLEIFLHFMMVKNFYCRIYISNLHVSRISSNYFFLSNNP